MSDRDELALIVDHHEKPGYTTWVDKFGVQRTVWECMCGWKSDEQIGFDTMVANDHITDAILTAGWRKPREITTDDFSELFTLPLGTIVQAIDDPECVYRKSVHGWHMFDEEWDYDVTTIDLPVRVLWESR